MQFDDSYLSLLNILIYDKRVKQHGMLTEFCYSKTFGHGGFYYKAYMNKIHSNHYIFVEDFEKGNVVFLMPYGVKYLEKEMAELKQKKTQVIKEFFGKKFRKDMIIEMPEEERQKQIADFEKVICGFENWSKFDFAKDGKLICTGKEEA